MNIRQHPIWLGVVLLLLPTLPLWATTGERIGPPETTQPQVFSGRILVDVQDDHKLVAAVDAYEGMALADGWLDKLFVFVSEDTLEPLRYDGFGMLRLEERHATLVLPEYEQILVLSLDGELPSEMPRPDHGNVQVLTRGLVLATHSPAARQTLSEALNAEQTRQRYQPLTDRPFLQEPKEDLPTCNSSCSVTCTDGSRCSTSCNSLQCAHCSCPADCFCGPRIGAELHRYP